MNIDLLYGRGKLAVHLPDHVVVTTSAGYPLDKTYYQTVKGMVGVMDIVEPGGDIIIASECSEGMGSPEFVEAQRLLCSLGPDRFMTLIQGRDRAKIDEWQTQMLVKALQVGSIHLYTTSLGEADLRDIYVRHITSMESAILQSVGAHGDPHIAVVPEGPYVIPLFKPGPCIEVPCCRPMGRSLQRHTNAEVFRGSGFRVKEGGFSSLKEFPLNAEHRTLNTR